MAQIVNFSSTSARFELPYLFAGQAQKEFTVNQVIALADALLHPVVQGFAATPPSSPNSGDCWIVDTNPSGDWAGQEGKIAAFAEDVWLFIAPTQMMQVYDSGAGQTTTFDGNAWQSAPSITSPTGGSTIDSQARAAIDDILSALQAAGITG